MLIIGCDYHGRYQQIALLDTDTGELVERQLEHPEPARSFYAALPRGARVGMEASGPAQWFERLLAECGHQLWVGDPAEIRRSVVRKQKTDRRDAAHLLTLLVENRFPRIWVPTPAERDLRQLLWHRHKLVGMRTALRNQLHALARSQGLCRGRQLWTERGRQQLATLELDHWASQRRQDLLGWLQRLDARVAELDQQVRGEVEQHPEAVRLMTHPGVGAIVALAFVLTLARVERFRRSKQVVSYLGLNPREFSSGGRQRLGAISKQGNTLLRWLLVEAAQTAARHDPELERDYRHLVFRRGRGVAKVAVARKLAVRLYWMWREKKNYAELIRRSVAPTPGSPQLVVVDSRPSVF
jgi:transposase